MSSCILFLRQQDTGKKVISILRQVFLLGKLNHELQPMHVQLHSKRAAAKWIENAHFAAAPYMFMKLINQSVSSSGIRVHRG